MTDKPIVTQKYGGLGQAGQALNKPNVLFCLFSDPFKGARSESAEGKERFSGSGGIPAQAPRNAESGESRGYLGVFGDDDANLVGGLTRISIQKTLQAPTGQFTIELMPIIPHGIFQGYTWDEILQDGDWVKISLMARESSEGAAGYSVMVGKIDNIGCSLSAGSDSVSARVTVTGRDFAAPAMDQQIYFNRHSQTLNNYGGLNMLGLLGTDKPDTIAGSPEKVVKNALKIGASNRMGLSLPPKLPKGLFGDEGEELWTDRLDFVEGVKGVRGTVLAPSMLRPPKGVSVWQWISAYRNEALNEMWIDMDNAGTHHFNFRERPFVNTEDGKSSPWFNLHPTKVPLVQVQNLNLTKGLKRVNHIFILVDLGPLNRSQYAYVKPYIHVEDFRRHGLKRLEFKTPYYNTDFSKANSGKKTTSAKDAEKHAKEEIDKSGAYSFKAICDEVPEWISLLVDWHCLNPYYYSGTVDLATIRPDVRIGSKVVFTGGPSPVFKLITKGEVRSRDCGTCMTAYVEGVSHTWSSDPWSATTQIQVTRMYPEDKRLDDIKKHSAQWIAEDKAGADKKVVKVASDSSESKFDDVLSEDQKNELAGAEHFHILPPRGAH